MSTAVKQKKKSGLRTMAPGEKLFNEGDPSHSLYIIQKGQIRLFKPKGKGFVELAILRAGEVLGEMAFFDEKGGRRSCSAEALVSTEVIEVSFHAFGKAIENLNPWFKSIITTLTERLRKTNLKIKELESNSTIGGYGKGEAEYSFLQNIDVVKILSVIYLCFKSHGESSEQGIQLNRQTLNFYALEIFNCKEAKLEAFLNLLKDLGHMTVERDEQGQPKIYQLHHSQALRNYVIFLQKQRSVVEEKKVQVSTQCEYFLSRILQEGRAQNIEKESAMIDLRPLLNEFKEKKVMVDEDDLVDAIGLGLLGDPQIGDNQALTSEIQFSTLKELYPNLRLVNAIKKLNESKSGKAS